MRAYLVEILTTDGRGSETVVQVVGPEAPDLVEKIACLELVVRLADEGWTIASHGSTAIGWLARRAAEASRVPFVDLDRVRALRRAGADAQPMLVSRSADGLTL